MNDANKVFEDQLTQPYILEALRNLHVFDRQTRDATVQRLRGHDLERVFKVLEELLNSLDLDLRCDAAEAAMRVDPQRGMRLILPLLQDPEAVVRAHICGLLHDFGNADTVEPLTQVLIHDPDSQVRFIAAYALEVVGDARALPALAWAYDHDAGEDYEGRKVRDNAADAIKNIEERMS